MLRSSCALFLQSMAAHVARHQHLATLPLLWTRRTPPLILGRFRGRFLVGRSPSTVLRVGTLPSKPIVMTAGAAFPLVASSRVRLPTSWAVAQRPKINARLR